MNKIGSKRETVTQKRVDFSPLLFPTGRAMNIPMIRIKSPEKKQVETIRKIEKQCLTQVLGEVRR